MNPLRTPRRRHLRWLSAGAALSACTPQGWGSSLFSASEPFEPPPEAPPEAAPEPSPAATPAPPPPVPVFYRPEYALAAHSFETTRKARWVHDSLIASGFGGLQITVPEPVGDVALGAIHDRAYINAVRTGQPRALAESQGFRWDPGLWSTVVASNGGIVAAALAALESGVAGSLSSGLHHARRARGNGYCTFNGLALAARAALAFGVRNVLILDLDAHCGGGTSELLGTHPNVWIVDVAVHAFDRYTPLPRHTLDVVSAARQYLPVLKGRLESLASRAPAFDLCLYNAGMDPHQGCPIGGLPGIDGAVLQDREAIVFEWCRGRGIPIAFSLAGGYIGPGLSQAGLTELHRLTLAAAAHAARPRV